MPSVDYSGSLQKWNIKNLHLFQLEKANDPFDIGMLLAIADFKHLINDLKKQIYLYTLMIIMVR